MIKISKSLFAIIIIVEFVWCIPRFSTVEGSSCITCHVNPTGGGMRNDHGSNVFSLDELPYAKWLDEGSSDWDGSINDFVNIGGDFRVQAFQYTDTLSNQIKNAFFAMQADIYTDIRVNDKLEIFYKHDFNPRLPNPEYWILINLSSSIWVRVGKTAPNYGMKIDDHTSFIRGGNIRRKQGLNIEGLPFDPMKQKPTIFEMGYSNNNMFYTFSISNNYLSSSNTEYGYNETIKEKNKSFNISYIQSDKFFNSIISLNIMNENEISLYGLNGGLSINNVVWSWEVDIINDWISNQSQAIYHELAYQITQGIYATLKHDFFDPDVDFQSGSINRYTLGFEFYPFNVLEIKLQARQSILENSINNKPSPEYLLQFHSWF